MMWESMYKDPVKQKLAVKEAVRRFRAKNAGSSKTGDYQDCAGSTNSSPRVLQRGITSDCNVIPKVQHTNPMRVGYEPPR